MQRYIVFLTGTAAESYGRMQASDAWKRSANGVHATQARTASVMATILISSPNEVDDLIEQVSVSAAHLSDWIASFQGDHLALLRALKFETIGCHPLGKHALNAVEQINQTWTYLAALASVRVLLELHPEAGGFSIAPGAHAAQPLDVMSKMPGLVGAETFATVDPRNNNKLSKDLDKLKERTETHRYVFFASPLFPGTSRLERYERGGVQVWSVAV